jgi:hypothetical protein
MIRNIYLKFEVDTLRYEKVIMKNIFLHQNFNMKLGRGDAYAGASMAALHILHVVELKWVCLFDWLGSTSHRHSKSLMATFQLYWRRKASGALLFILSGTNWQLCRTTDVPNKFGQFLSNNSTAKERIQFKHEGISGNVYDINGCEVYFTCP